MVECTALEMRHRRKPIGGSNPSLSATIHHHKVTSKPLQSKAFLQVRGSVGVASGCSPEGRAICRNSHPLEGPPTAQVIERHPPPGSKAVIPGAEGYVRFGR